MPEINKTKITIYTVFLQAAIIFTFAFPTLILLDALYYKAIQQFLPLILISPFIAALSFIQAVVRKTKINYIDKTVEIHDGLSIYVFLLPLTVRSVTKTKLRYKITTVENNKTSTYDLIFALYTKKNIQKILNAILEFNPDANIT